MRTDGAGCEVALVGILPVGRSMTVMCDSGPA
jgi:hypothetical protein